MRYYIRQNPKAGVEGPFTREELLARASAGSLSQDSFASSDMGERIERLARGRTCDWFPVSRIPALRHLFPLPEPEEPVPQPLTLISLMIGIPVYTVFFIAIWFGPNWLLLVMLPVVVIVRMIQRFARQEG